MLLVVLLINDDLRLGQLLDQNVPLIEVTNKDIQGLSPDFDTTLVAEDILGQDELLGLVDDLLASDFGCFLTALLLLDVDDSAELEVEIAEDLLIFVFKSFLVFPQELDFLKLSKE